jgi:hypothetical protein
MNARNRSSTGLGAAVLDACRRSVGTRQRKGLILITALLGLLSAVAVMAAVEPPERIFDTVAAPVQTLMSITLPFLGILLVSDVRTAHRWKEIVPTLLAAIVVAVVVAVFGILVCAAAVALAPSEAVEGRWHQFGLIAVGSVLVQVLAQLVGTGLGLLVRSVVLAWIASIVLPLGLWLALGVVDSLSAARAWLTPYAAATNLLSGQMSPVMWAQWLVVFLLWGVGLNVLGATQARRRG